MNKTAEDLRNEYWTGHKQYSIYRHGKRDGIVVLLCNPPWGRCKAPFVEFLIFKNGEKVTSSSSYEDMRFELRKLKAQIMFEKEESD